MIRDNDIGLSLLNILFTGHCYMDRGNIAVKAAPYGPDNLICNPVIDNGDYNEAEDYAKKSGKKKQRDIYEILVRLI